MALILCIETSQQEASVALSAAGKCVALERCRIQKEQASFLQPAIQSLMRAAGYRFSQLDAVAVSEGPGSYTGLRVGMASAKGLCYALNKPLISISTLLCMAAATREVVHTELKVSDYRIVPMIDARRNEVFTAVYDAELQILASPFACILHDDAFAAYSDKKLVFSGGGAAKWNSQCKQRDCYFPEVDFNASSIVAIANKKFLCTEFTPVEVAVPFYLKEFQTIGVKI